MISCLEPLKSEPVTRPLWGFDIETYGEKNRFLMASIVGDYGVKKVFWDKDDVLDYMTRHKSLKMFSKGYITATNLQFDFMGLIDKSRFFNSFSPIIRNSKFLLVKLPVDGFHTLKFIDTGSFCFFSVKKWGDIVGLPKLPPPSCFRRKPKNMREKEELERYNLRDSEITYKAIKMIQEGFNSLGGNIKITVSSSALDLYRRRYQRMTYYHPPKYLLEYLYRGYYGGRVEAVKRGAVKNLKYYDFNSLYPSVMTEEYPDPNHYKYSQYITLKTVMEHEGICLAELVAPNLHIPYLPTRLEKPDKKLIFPKGELKGYYSFYELRKALERGYKILKLYDGIIYFKKFYPFKDYIEKLYSLRRKQKDRGDPLELITKLSMNSLYGKFAQKIDEKDEIVHESKVTYDMIQKALSVERNGKFFTFKKKFEHIPSFINPIFSIYTTAYAREKLYSYIERCRDKLYYYDTDSLMTSKSFEDSKKLGRLKLEFQVREGVIIKPKMYMIDTKVKCKGLGLMMPDEFMELLKSKKRKMERFVKFKEANKRGLCYNEILSYDKVIDLEDNKRRWPARFSPFELQESEALKI